MKKIILFTAVIFAVLGGFTFASAQIVIGYKDSAATHDTCYVITDSIYHLPIYGPSRLHVLYANQMDSVIGKPAIEDAFLSWAAGEGVTDLAMYARAFLKNYSKHKTLDAFITKAKIKYKMLRVGVDYRGDSWEIAAWETYQNARIARTSFIDYMVTEIEPYISGNYISFYNALRTGDAFTSKYGMDLNVYMGQPATWDSIVKYADCIYLSNYISMAIYTRPAMNGKPAGPYLYIQDRVNKIAAAAKKINKVQKFANLVSLEKKTLKPVGKWKNDFMGDQYYTHSFYGSTSESFLNCYNTYATPDAQLYTDQVGDVIFCSEIALQIRPFKN